MDKLCNTTEKYFEDEAQLRAIFPEEIWLLILNKNNGAEYYQNCSTASPYFHKLLYPHRARHLFPDVIKQLTNFIFLTPEAYPEFLKCRLVCHTWKLGVDHEFQNILNQCDPHDWYWITPRDPSDPTDNKKASLLYSFFSENQMNRFLEFFHDSHFLTGTNPFSSRAIQITIRPPSETMPTYYENLVKLLRTYGHHIWHCFLILQYRIRGNSDIKSLMDIFSSILESQQQLRSLRIHSMNNFGQYTGFLENVLRTKTLPKFDKLELLEGDELARPVLSSLIQSNTQITKLIICNQDWNVPTTVLSYSRILSTPLLKLEELHFSVYNSTETLTILQDLQVAWPLKKLTLVCHPDIPNVESVFTFLETRWAETLTDLNIEIYGKTLQARIPKLNLRELALPNVKNLKIETGFYTSMDFILPMVNSLTSLRVTVNCTVKCNQKFEKKSKVKFFLHSDNLLKSNIWSYFRKLRELTYASLIFGSPIQEHRRDHWEKYNFKDV